MDSSYSSVNGRKLFYTLMIISTSEKLKFSNIEATAVTVFKFIFLVLVVVCFFFLNCMVLKNGAFPR